MSEHHFLVNICLALGAALLGGMAARLLRLPVLIGYLVAGFLVGPHTPGFVAHVPSVNLVAELGVVLLMFAVGVHFSLDELRAVQRTALLGGGFQILGTVALGVLLGMALGWGLFGGLFFGCALALSSTAVMMKALEERGEQGTAHGKVMLGILVVQDLTLVAMISLLPALATLSERGVGAVQDVLLAALKAGGFIAVTVLLAMRLVPALLQRVARLGSTELFLMTVLTICLLTAWAGETAGLGLELGAFMAGIVISESDYAHEVFSQVRPIRDVFASLFFVSIGMLLDPKFVAQHALAVSLTVALIVFGKSVLSFLGVYLLGWHGRTALLAGLGLAQVGEFSFVLATVGSARKLIPGEIANVILSSALISLLLAPFLFQAAPGVYKALNRTPRLSRWLNRQSEQLEASGAEAKACRVLVLGYGRVGRYVSNALRTMGVPHLVVDYDANALKRLRDSGVATLYGDASSPTVLEHAHPQQMEMAVVALPEAAVAEMTVRQLKRLAPSLPVLARVHRGVDIPAMRKAGADAVIHAEFEAGAEMIRQSLRRLEMDEAAIAGYLQEVRLHRYREEENLTG